MSKETSTQKRNGKAAARPGKTTKAKGKKETTANEATLRAWKKTYENRARTGRTTAR